MKKLILLSSVALAIVSCQKIQTNPKTQVITNVSSQAAPSISYPSTGNLTVGAPVSLIPTNSGGTVPGSAYGQVTTIAGSSVATAGFLDNATGTSALFNEPEGIVQDASGNLFIADGSNNAIRRVDGVTGAVTTYAGSSTGVAGFSNGSLASATFDSPDGLAFDAAGNLYVSDYNNNAIRKISGGTVSTFYSTANPFGPVGLCFDSAGNLVVACQDADQIWKINSSAVVTIVAGNYPGYANGTGSNALFRSPTDVKLDAAGNMYVVDFLNNAIRKITPAGVATTLAGSDVDGNAEGYAAGTGTSAVFNNPSGLAVGPGGVIYVEDIYNNDIRRIMPDGSVYIVSGSAVQVPGNQDGTGLAAQLNQPDFMYIDGSGTGYFTELSGNRLRKVTLTGYSISPALPAGLTLDPGTGIISGTPTAATDSPITYTITAYNASGISSTTITLSVKS